MNVYTIYVFNKNSTSKIESKNVLILSSTDEPFTISCHGAANLDRAFKLLLTKTPQEISDMICPYCCGFWDTHTSEQKAEHKKELS